MFILQFAKIMTEAIMTFWFDEHVKNIICYPLRKENEMSSPHFQEVKARDMGGKARIETLIIYLDSLCLQQEGRGGDRGGEVKSRKAGW